MPLQSLRELPLRSFPTCQVTRREIINSLWGLSSDPSHKTLTNINYDSYFSYYIEQCNLALHDGERHISSKSHQDIIDIAAKIRSQVKHEDLKVWLTSALPSPRLKNEEEQINGSIDLAARLLSMINIGELHYVFLGRKPLMWSENSLERWIKDHFDTPRDLDNEHVKLEKIFIAPNFGRIARIEIQFTSNLSDHLRLSEDDKKVAIFHHASFLTSQRDRYVYSSRKSQL